MTASTSLREAPGPTGPAHAQALRQFKSDGLGFFTRMASEYGDMVQFRVGLSKSFLASHPAYIREVLVTGHHRYIKASAYQKIRMVLGNALLTSDGEIHRRHRRMIQPIMHHERIGAYGPIMSEHAARVRDRWTDGETVDVYREMLRLTLQIVGKCLYDTDFEDEGQSKLTDALNAAIQLFSREGSPQFLLTKPHIREGLETLQGAIADIIDERRRTGHDPGDLVSLLLKASDPEGTAAPLTDEEVFQHSLGLVVGGHETTASALTWTWYLIATNPEVEAKLFEEVDRVLEGQLPTPYDVVHRLPYTNLVFMEALRLYPSAYVLTRKSIVDHEIDGYAVPSESSVFVPQWVAHRDPRWFPEADRFMPERWLPGGQPDIPKYAYFPFGGGPRVCIGEPFAELEAPIAIATLAGRWKMRLAKDADPQPDPLTTLRVRNGMPMVLTERRP